MRNGSAASRCLSPTTIDPDMLDERARALLDYVDPNDLTLMYETAAPRDRLPSALDRALELGRRRSPKLIFPTRIWPPAVNPPARQSPTSAMGRFRLWDVQSPARECFDDNGVSRTIMAVAQTKPTAPSTEGLLPAADLAANDTILPRIQQGPGARGAAPDAPDPPVRGEGRPDVRHGPDRRLLPPLYRPGSGGRRHEARHARRRPDDHRLSRSRPHAGLRHGPEGRHGRTHRPARRLFQGQGRLDAHVLAGEEILRRARHRRRPGSARHRPGLRQQISRQRRRLPDLFRRRRGEPGPGL